MWSDTPLRKVQIVEGDWEGESVLYGRTVRFGLHVRISDGRLKVAFDCQNAGFCNIPVQSMTIAGRRIRFSVGILAAQFDGVYDVASDWISGEIVHGCLHMPVTLHRQARRTRQANPRVQPPRTIQQMAAPMPSGC